MGLGRFVNTLVAIKMETTLLLITTQVSEADEHDGIWWKPKGSQIFSLNVNSDLFLHAEKECILAIKQLLNEWSNPRLTYTYVSHELIFKGIKKLNDASFEKFIEIELQKPN